jgi:hypothetical protein
MKANKMLNKEHQHILKVVSAGYINRRSPETTPSEEEIKQLDNVLQQIRFESPDRFLATEDFAKRRFYHKPSSKIAYASFVTGEKVKQQED